jgi:transcriptional regulator with XRE-family HTH domain
MLRENLRRAFDASGLYVKDIAAKAGVNKRTIDEWTGKRAKMPQADDLYKVCRAVSITVEEALDGEDGKEYVRNWVFEEATDYLPPPRIADIVDNLLNMDDKSLSIIRGTIGGITEGEKAVWPEEERTRAAAG